tara:strand:+ start:490 stop:648 length:159 start_codon:yes stop_codon:yes gene_type:complete
MDNDHDEIVAQLQKLTKDVAIIQYGLGKFLGKQAHKDWKAMVKVYKDKGIKP